MKILSIEWRRLVTADGESISQCNEAYAIVLHAIDKLREHLRPMGIEPSLVIKPISENESKTYICETNQIFINGVLISLWLDNSSMQTKTQEPCRAYQLLSQELIVSAGLKAAALML